MNLMNKIITEIIYQKIGILQKATFRIKNLENSIEINKFIHELKEFNLFHDYFVYIYLIFNSINIIQII